MKVLGVCLVALVALASYWNSKDCDFVFDDHLAIRTNPDVEHHNVSIFARDGLFYHDFWGKDLMDIASHKSYRPFTILTFRLTHYFFEFNAYYYHLTNVFLHAIVSALVTWFLFYLNSTNQPDPEQDYAAIFGGLLFAIHPVHVEAVTGTVGRAELLCAIFVILGVVCGSNASTSSSFLKTCAWFTLAVILSACAILSKETGLTVFPLIGVYDLFLNVCPNIIFKGKFSLSKKKLKELAPFFIRTVFLLACVGGYFVARTLLMSDSFTPSDATLANSKLVRRTENPLQFTTGLSPEYSYNCIPMVESFEDPRNLLTIALYLFLIGFLSYSFLKKSWVNITLSAWVALPYLPVSHFFFTVGTLIAERTLYLPSMGKFFAWLPSAIPGRSKGQPNLKAKIVVFSVLLCILAVGIHTTYLRTEDWVNDTTLFRQAIVTCPNSSKMHHQYGQILQNLKNHSGALKHFQIAKKIDPLFCDVDFHIALHYLHQMDYGIGFELLKKNIDCLFSGHKAYGIIGQIMEVWLKQPGNASACEDYASVLEYFDNKSASTYYREAGVIYLGRKELIRANMSFNNAHRVSHRCDIYYWKGKLSQAFREKYPKQDKLYLNKAVGDFREGMLCIGEEAKAAGPACLTELYQIVMNTTEQPHIPQSLLKKVGEEISIKYKEFQKYETKQN